MGGFLHLAKRFFGSLVPFGPASAETAWAEQQLLPGEVTVWRAMSRADRRHAVGVAHRVEATLGSDATRPVLAAALLHDAGKAACGLGTFARVGVTLAAAALGRERVAGWSGRPSVRGRAADYVRHAEIGAAMLQRAGSDPTTVAWAAEHHLPERKWTVPRAIGVVLKSADDD